MIDPYDLLCLLSVPGIGPHRIRRLVGKFGTPASVLQTNVRELLRVEGIDEKTARIIKSKVDKAFADDQLSKAQKYGVKLLSYWDPRYPGLLKKIYDPPIILYIKGVIDGKSENKIAVVGTRSATSYGRWAAERIGEDLARQGIDVVSGMARGIDTMAHRGALKANGKTIAVLGSGLDVIYPPENRRLFNQIIQNGAVVSEFPLGTEPAAGHFPRRNRIISGLSLGTVVVEAGQKSGALITAFMALEQGRDVFAVPGSIRSQQSRGPHRLIKEGAKLIENVEDIIAEIPEWQKREAHDKQTKDIVESLATDEKKLWDVLSHEPLHIDQVAAQANVTTSEALALLLSMELKNCVQQLSGMMFVRM